VIPTRSSTIQQARLAFFDATPNDNQAVAYVRMPTAVTAESNGDLVQRLLAMVPVRTTIPRQNGSEKHDFGDTKASALLASAPSL